jgi:hypothetical protein
MGGLRTKHDPAPGAQRTLDRVYDARFDSERFHPGLSQFVSRYSADVLLARGSGTGLLLDVGVPDWRLDAAAMD